MLILLILFLLRIILNSKKEKEKKTRQTKKDCTGRKKLYILVSLIAFSSPVWTGTPYFNFTLGPSVYVANLYCIHLRVETVVNFSLTRCSIYLTSVQNWLRMRNVLGAGNIIKNKIGMVSTLLDITVYFSYLKYTYALCFSVLWFRWHFSCCVRISAV